MARSILIHTPENVELEFPLAGLGSRFMATLVDSLIQGGVLVAIGLVFLLAAGAAEVALEAGGWFVGAWVLAAFIVIWGYYVFFETAWAGQTPGKRLFALRVIREGGYPLDFRGALVRNVVRLVDFLPGMYGVGVLFIFLHPQHRRVGDFAAGTYVVRERETVGSVAVSTAGPAPALPVGALTRGHLDLAEAFLRRRETLDRGLRADMAAEIAARLRAAMGLSLASVEPPETLIEAVVRRRAQDAGLS